MTEKSIPTMVEFKETLHSQRVAVGLSNQATIERLCDMAFEFPPPIADILRGLRGLKWGIVLLRCPENQES